MSLLLAQPFVRNVLLVVGLLALGLTAVWWLRRDAASDALNQAAAKAAQTQERIRTDADAAARAAERDGAAGRLRDGTF
ncbi:hypothetical protein [Roseococcus pinisoli]|uniref:Uncharacterized protein n=1 Tax=Roseococcus pinisoli TaxID=2835040 RepID=A0ABS5QC68_9PROT|nr:hypothetical protein [Roseococcus pinisoli]MBS7810547.1 hypothetical protein [Roseococcus pinisoli]